MSFTPAETWLMDHDIAMARLVANNGPLTLQKTHRDDYFTALARSITGQQISVKAAATIFKRFVELTDCLPEKTIILTDEQVKYIGFSGQKWRYIRDLALHFVEDSAIYDHLDALDDDAVIADLTAVKGIGVWTAQMFLMFTLHRPDVFAPDDRGLQLAVQRLYELPATPTRQEMLAYAKDWAPYRTTASLHLWHSLDNVPTDE